MKQQIRKQLVLVCVLPGLFACCIGALPVMNMQPLIVSISPEDGAVNQAVNTVVKITYDVEIEPGSWEENTITLSNTSEASLVPISVAMDPASPYVVVAAPSSWLDVDTTYIIVVNPGIKGANGTTSPDSAVSSFRTYCLD